MTYLAHHPSVSKRKLVAVFKLLTIMEILWEEFAFQVSSAAKKKITFAGSGTEWNFKSWTTDEACLHVGISGQKMDVYWFSQWPVWRKNTCSRAQAVQDQQPPDFTRTPVETLCTLYVWERFSHFLPHFLHVRFFLKTLFILSRVRIHKLYKAQSLSPRLHLCLISDLFEQIIPSHLCLNTRLINVCALCVKLLFLSVLSPQVFKFPNLPTVFFPSQALHHS